MRMALLAGVALAFSTTGFAQAATVTVTPTVIGEKAQTKFDEKYGAREIAPLTDYLQRQVTRALEKAGADVGPGGALRVETTLVAAKPNKPTFKELGDRIGLDYMRSRSIGGADLSAKLIDASGRVVDQIDFRWYDSDLRWVMSEAPWSGAETAIRLFAIKVADRYEQQAPRAMPAGS